MSIAYEEYFSVPLYQKKGNKIIIIDNLLMRCYTSPFARCVECISNCEIRWYATLEYLKNASLEDGSLYVVLDDFNDNNKVKNIKQLRDYGENFKEKYFYKMLKELKMIDDKDVDIDYPERNIDRNKLKK